MRLAYVTIVPVVVDSETVLGGAEWYSIEIELGKPTRTISTEKGLVNMKLSQQEARIAKAIN